MRYRHKTSSLLVILFMLTTAGHAEIYKWVDEQGRVHYGEKPPTDNARQLHITPGAGQSGPAPLSEAERRDKQQRLLRAFEEERRIQQAQQQEQEASEAQRQRNCAEARDTLRRQQNAGYLYDLDEQGQRRVLSDEERRQSEDKIARAVRYWCQQ